MDFTGSTLNADSEIGWWWRGGRGGSLVGCGSKVHYVWPNRFVAMCFAELQFGAHTTLLRVVNDN